MKNKFRFTIRMKLALLSAVVIAVAVATLGVFLSISFSNSAYETAKTTLENVSENAYLSMENAVNSVETSMNLLAYQIGFNEDFANNIIDIQDESNTEAKEKIENALAGKDGNGDGSTIIGSIDYLVVNNSDIESATMYSPFAKSTILNRLFPVDKSKIECTEERYSSLINHPGTAKWFCLPEDSSHIYVWRALVNFGVIDNYDMQVVGFIEYVFSKDKFMTCITDTQYNNEGMILLDENNNVVVSLSSGVESLDKEVANNLSKFNLGINNEKNYTVSKKAYNAKNWTYISFINHNAIDEIRTSSRNLIIIIVSISVVGAALVAFLLSAREIRRIKAISKAALQIAEGNYDTRAKVSSNDELTDQTKAINLMAENIQDLINELIDLNKKLVIQSDSLTENFATVVSNKSGESGYHVRRVSSYSEILARKLGFNEEQVHTIKIASTLHDIGKLMIDDSILHKPGRFTDEERAIMQQHVTYGAQVLKNVPGDIMETGAKIALYHHERWDGTGYVNGLKGDEIPIEAQIASVADVFDALISKRCYKDSWSIEDARDEIVKNSGTQFSPKVVEAFVEAFDEIKKVAIMYEEKENQENN